MRADNEVKSLLVVRYSALGDVVLATSVLAPLRARFPGARIEWVTDRSYASLLQGLPELAAVHVLERDRLGSTLMLSAQLLNRFDLAIDLQNKVRSAFICRISGRRRMTFRRRTPGQALLAIAGTDPPLARAHATALYAEALAPLGIGAPGPLRVHLSSQAKTLGADALAAARPPIVAIAPGARWATKRWSTERFAALADTLAAGGASIVLAGGPSDREATDVFKAAVRAPIAADLSILPLDALAAALGQVNLLVACDSGPVHLATAVGTPALALFGPTSAVRWGPPEPGRALSIGIACAPCSNHGGETCPEGHHRCMAELTLEQVVDAAREMLVP